MGVLKKKKREQGGQEEEILVMDVGTGTGLLSLEAARVATDGGQAVRVRVVACEGFPAVAAVAEKVVAAAGMGGTCVWDWDCVTLYGWFWGTCIYTRDSTHASLPTPTTTETIAVLPQRSTALLPPAGERETVDLVVSELLDSTLLGEGYLASLRDLARRGFLRKGGCLELGV